MPTAYTTLDSLVITAVPLFLQALIVMIVDINMWQLSPPCQATNVSVSALARLTMMMMPVGWWWWYEGVGGRCQVGTVRLFSSILKSILPQYAFFHWNDDDIDDDNNLLKSVLVMVMMMITTLAMMMAIMMLTGKNFTRSRLMHFLVWRNFKTRWNMCLSTICLSLDYRDHDPHSIVMMMMMMIRIHILAKEHDNHDWYRVNMKLPLLIGP